MNKPKIYIAIPTRDGQIFFELSLRLSQWSKQATIKTTVVYHPFLSPIDHARNVIVSSFLRTDYTHLLMIDADIVPPINTLERLLFHDKDIIAAACPLMGPDKNGKLITTMNAYNLDTNDQFKPVDLIGIQRVDGVGTGCILIKRKVLEDMKAPPFMTQYDTNGLKYRGEDLNFCYQAKLNSIDTYVDFKLRCKHIKLCNLLEL